MAKFDPKTEITGSGKTFEKAFQDVSADRSSPEYAQLLDELINKVSRRYSLYASETEELKKQLEKVKDTGEIWATIDRTLSSIVGSSGDLNLSLSDASESLKNIVADLTGVSGMVRDHVRLLNKVKDIGSELSTISSHRNNVEASNLENLHKRASKNYAVLIEQANSVARSFNFKVDPENLERGVEDAVKALQVLEDEKTRLDGILRNSDLSLEERRETKNRIRYLGVQISLLDPQTLASVKTIRDATKELNDISRHYDKVTKNDPLYALGKKIGIPDVELKRLERKVELYEKLTKLKQLSEYRDSIARTIQNNTKLLKSNRLSEKKKADLEKAQERLNVELAVSNETIQEVSTELTNKSKEAFKSTGRDIVAEWIKSPETWNKFSIFLATLSTKIVKSLVQSFHEVDKVAVELQRRVGSYEIEIGRVNTKVASTVDMLNTMLALAKETRLYSQHLFEDSQIAKAADIKVLTGATDEQMSRMLISSKLIGQDIKSYQSSMINAARESNIFNGTLVNAKEVQEGVLSASKATTVSLGNSATALARAVTIAKSLGLELSDVEKIAEGLLNYESSIAAEMQAELLTGMNLNLQRAREYALVNDLEGVTTELVNQGVTMSKFTGLTFIGQKNLAAALGMSREQMAQMLILQELQNGASVEAVAAAAGMTVEELNALSVQDRFNKTVEKLKQSFVEVFEILRPIVETISKIANKISGWNSGIKSFIVGLLVISSLTKKLFGTGIIGMIVGRVGRRRNVDKLQEMVRTTVSGASNPVPPVTPAATQQAAQAARQTATQQAAQAARQTATQQAASQGTRAAAQTGNVTSRAMRDATAGGRSANRFKGLGRVLRSFARTVTPIIGQLLVIAVAILAVGAAIWMAGKGIQLIATAVKGLTWEHVGMLLGLSGAILVLAGAAALFSTAGIGVVVMVAALAGIMWALSKAVKNLSLSTLVSNLNQIVTTIKSFRDLKGIVDPLVDSLRKLSTALIDLPTKKLIKVTTKIPKSVETSASAVIEGKAKIGGEKEIKYREVDQQKQADGKVDLGVVQELLLKIYDRLGEGQIIQMDSEKVGRTLAYSTTSLR